MKAAKFGLETEFNSTFYETVAPIKLTEGRRIKLYNVGWGLLTEYYLESVKITWQKTGVVSAATLKIGDKSGHSACVVRGPTMGLLFGLSATEWMDIEKLCGHRQQLFYRYFKNGLSKHFGYEQKLFYNFCLSSQKADVLVAIFRRCVNMRKKDKNDAFLDILELRKCDNSLLDVYINFLRKDVEGLTS